MSCWRRMAIAFPLGAAWLAPGAAVAQPAAEAPPAVEIRPAAETQPAHAAPSSAELRTSATAREEGLPPRREEPREEPEEEDHAGGFARLTVGLGLGHVEGGALGPEPGFRPVDAVTHTAPVLGIAMLFGGGVKDIAVAGELMYERMLKGLDQPSDVSFSLFGLGISGTAYSDEEWFVTAHLRWLMMLLWKSEIPCWFDRGDATMGPGIGLSLGKEWFDKDDDDEDAIGIALQLNYASLSGEPKLDYYSAMLALTLSSF